MTFDVNKHELVPKHSKVSDSEKAKLFETFGIVGRQLPRISEDDTAITQLGVKVGDIIKVERASKTAGTTIYYRLVVEA
jgi:DNA-directed RNA polymerase subunit H (RpoH/RPB5)